MKLLCMNGHLSDSNDQMKSDFGFDYYRLDNNKSSRTLFMKVSINGCKKGGTSKSNNQKIKILIKNNSQTTRVQFSCPFYDILQEIIRNTFLPVGKGGNEVVSAFFTHSHTLNYNYTFLIYSTKCFNKYMFVGMFIKQR